MKNTAINVDLALDEASLVDLVQRTFPKGEPMAQALDLRLDDYEAYSRLVCAKAVSERCSILARYAGQAVGFCINEDFASAPVYSRAEISPKMAPILALLEDLDGLGEKPREGEVFHLYMLGVDPKWAGQGVGGEAVRASLYLARELGYRRAIVEATGPLSLRICQRRGFREIASIEYASYRYNGRNVFAGLTEATHCRLLALEL